MELIIIRHGETDENKRGCFLGVTDAILNEKGLKQAHIAGEKIADMGKDENIKIDSIYTSPLRRSVQTADIIREKLRCTNIIIDENIKERDFGAWDGLTLKEISNLYPDEYGLWMNDSEYCIEGAESIGSVKKRIKAFLDNIKSLPPEGIHIIVTHLGCIRYMLAFLLNFEDEFSWRFRVDNGGLTKVQINDEGYAFLTMLNG